MTRYADPKYPEPLYEPPYLPASLYSERSMKEALAILLKGAILPDADLALALRSVRQNAAGVLVEFESGDRFQLSVRALPPREDGC